LLCPFWLANLWPRRKLAGAAHRAVFDMRYVAIDQHVSIGVCHPERIRPRPHAGIRLHKVIVDRARHREPLAAGKVFQPGNGVAVIAGSERLSTTDCCRL